MNDWGHWATIRKYCLGVIGSLANSFLEHPLNSDCFSCKDFKMAVTWSDAMNNVYCNAFDLGLISAQLKLLPATSPSVHLPAESTAVST